MHGIKSLSKLCNCILPTSMHLACLLKFIMNYQEDVEPDMFQREHHKTKYYLVKLWPELVSSS